MTTISTHIACKNTKSLRDKQVQNGSQLKKWYKTIKFGAKVVRYYDKNCHYRDFLKKQNQIEQTENHPKVLEHQ